MEESRTALVSKWCEKINSAKNYWKDDFDRMEKSIEYGRHGCDLEKWDPEIQYTVNLIREHIKSRTASLYAKNPTAVAKSRKRMEYEIWDGDMGMLLAAQNLIQTVNTTPEVIYEDPSILENYKQASMLLSDVQKAEANKNNRKKIGTTLEILLAYYMDQQDVKQEMKDLVRRVCTTGVGYIKLGFDRMMEATPENMQKMQDISVRISNIERLIKENEDGDIEKDSAELEELKIALDQLNKEEIVSYEGLVFDFPDSNAIIIDPRVKKLKGFKGASWVAHEFMMSKEEIDSLYDIDVSDNSKAYSYKDKSFIDIDKDTSDDCLYSVYEIWDRSTGTVLYICDGYDDFLKEPESPPVWVENGIPIYALTFNDVEDPKNPFPPSDVDLVFAQQDEYNRRREGLSKHARHALPKYVSPKGMLDEEDKEMLANGVPFQVVELKALEKNQDVSKVVQQMKLSGVDYNLYETSSTMDDFVRAVGSPEASFGAMTSSGTATEASIAEGSRVSGVQSNIDDMDMFLSRVVRGAGQILMTEMSVDQVKKIVGIGAVWPELSMQELSNEIYLDIKAGSSGKPNSAQELAKLERAFPALSQIPGISPEWVAKKYLEALDPGIDISEAFIENLPSIVSSNRSMQTGTGNPETDPNMQDQNNIEQNSGNPGGGTLYPVEATNNTGRLL